MTSKVHYCVIGAGPVGHPQEVFQKIAERQGWKVVSATPDAVGNCWIFEIEEPAWSNRAYMPSYISFLNDKQNPA